MQTLRVNGPSGLGPHACQKTTQYVCLVFFQDSGYWTCAQNVRAAGPNETNCEWTKEGQRFFDEENRWYRKRHIRIDTEVQGIEETRTEILKMFYTTLYSDGSAVLWLFHTYRIRLRHGYNGYRLSLNRIRCSVNTKAIFTTRVCG